MKVTFEFCGERYSPTLADARDHRVSNEKTLFVVDCFSGVSVNSDGFDEVMHLLEGYFALLLKLAARSASIDVRDHWNTQHRRKDDEMQNLQG